MQQDSRTPSLQHALEDVATHGRALVTNRVELLTLEAKEAAGRMGQQVLRSTIALLVGLCGFALLSAGMTFELSQHIGMSKACLALGGGYVILAVLLIGRARSASSTARKAMGRDSKLSKKNQEAEHALH